MSLFYPTISLYVKLTGALFKGFNGQKLSKDQPIRVEWITAAAPEPQLVTPLDGGDGIYVMQGPEKGMSKIFSKSSANLVS